MNIELRDAGPNAWTLEGTVTTYSKPYLVAHAVGEPGAVYYEEFAPGALDTTLSGVDDVDLRVEHDQSMKPLASTTTRDLKFSDGDTALLLGAALSKGRLDVHDAVRRIQSRELRGLSVGMNVYANNWGKAGDGRTALRRILRARLGEVSLVSRPMNPHSTIESLRRENRGSEVEYRFIPLRQDASGTFDDGAGDSDVTVCIHCGGSGRMPDGSICPVCSGSGLVDADAADDVQEGRRERTDAEVEALGKKGLALKVGDHYAWPIVDRIDLKAAIQSYGSRG